MEEEVGITEFVDATCEPLGGIVKQRYSDFCVNEVDEDGNVADLRCAVLDEALLASEPAGAGSAGVVHLRSEDEVRAAIPAEAGEAFIAALCHALATGDDATLPTSAPVDSKDARTAVHRAVRELSGGRLSSSATADGAVAVSRATARDTRRAAGPRPRYARCVLWKELMGTAEAVGALVRRLHVHPRDVSYAGTKDRRAVTAQYVCVALRSGVTARRLAGAGGTLSRDGAFAAPVSTGRPHWALGNVEAADAPLGLGDLSGNCFTLVLRDASYGGDAAALAGALSRLETRGFVNYYGLQRFGTGLTPTHSVGLALLCGDFAAAVALIIGGAPVDTRRYTGEQMLHTDRLGPVLDAVTDAVTDDVYGAGIDEGIDAVYGAPTDAATDTVTDAAPKTAPRTAPRTEPRSESKTESKTEPNTTLNAHERAGHIFWEGGDAAAALAVLPAKCIAERALLSHYARAGTDWRADARAAVAALPRETRLLYVHAFQSALWNALASQAVRDARAAGVDDLGALGELAVPGYETMAEIDAALLERVLSDVSHGLLGSAEYARACRRPGLWDLPGAHRPLVVRVAGLRVTVGRYASADDPLSHEALARHALAPSEPVRGCNRRADTEQSAVQTPHAHEAPMAYVGVALSFQLPTAAYATMALREVTRSSTSPAVHASLTAANRVS